MHLTLCKCLGIIYINTAIAACHIRRDLKILFVATPATVDVNDTRFGY